MRKIYLAVAVALVALSLGGCAGTGTKLGDLVNAATTTITNPVGTTDLYRVKNAYAAGLQVAVEYRDYCWKRPYVTLMADPAAKPVCEHRRAVVRALQKAGVNAHAAIVAAQNFIAQNPTLNAATAIAAAAQAVADFQNAVPAK